MNKKNISMILTTALFAAALSGCGSSSADTTVSAAKNTVSDTAKENAPENEADVKALSGKISVASNRTDLEERLSEYAQEFMDIYPGTTVEFETIKEYDDVIPTRIAGGEAPDLFYVVDPINQDTYKDYFLPLDDLDFTADDILFYEN